MYYYSTTYSYNTIRCGDENVRCDMNCANCERAEVVYSTRNQTTNNATQIHIVKKP